MGRVLYKGAPHRKKKTETNGHTYIQTDRQTDGIIHNPIIGTPDTTVHVQTVQVYFKATQNNGRAMTRPGAGQDWLGDQHLIWAAPS
jgi:hypothetical protein